MNDSFFKKTKIDELMLRYLAEMEFHSLKQVLTRDFLAGVLIILESGLQLCQVKLQD